MSYSNYHKKDIFGRPLHAETQMMSVSTPSCPKARSSRRRPPSRSARPRTAPSSLIWCRAASPCKASRPAGVQPLQPSQIVEDRLSLLDGSEAAADQRHVGDQRRVLAFLRPGDQMVQSVPLYGTETLISKIFPEWGIASPVRDCLSAASMREALEAAQGAGEAVLRRDAGQSHQFAGRLRRHEGRAGRLRIAPRLSPDLGVRQHAARSHLPEAGRARRGPVRVFADQVRRRPQRRWPAAASS